MAAFQLSSYLIFYYLIKFLGRKLTFFIGFLSIVIILSILLGFYTSEVQSVNHFQPSQNSYFNKQFFYSLLILPSTGLYQVIFLLANESFPTEIRGRAISLCSISARLLAAFTAPLITYSTVNNDFTVMYWLLLSLCCIQLISAWFLPSDEDSKIL